MPTATLTSQTNDAHVTKGDNTNYTTTHDAANGEGVGSGGEIFVGQQYPLASIYYGIWRAVIYFDLSSLGANLQILAASLQITCSTDFSTTDFTIRMVDGSVAEDTLAIADYGDLRTQTTAIADTITTNTWTGTKSFILNASGLAVLGGSTASLKKLCLRSENDINSTVPTTLERVAFATADDATPANRPTLTLVYTVLATAIPTVTTNSLTNISGTTATGNGRIEDIGTSSVTEHGHCWSTTGNPTTANSKTTKGAGSVGAFTSSITGLTLGTTYYVRAYATNSSGTGYGGTIQFIAGASSSQIPPGNIAIKGEHLVYITFSGNRRKILGDIY